MIGYCRAPLTPCHPNHKHTITFTIRELLFFSLTEFFFLLCRVHWVYTYRAAQLIEKLCFGGCKFVLWWKPVAGICFNCFAATLDSWPPDPFFTFTWSQTKSRPLPSNYLLKAYYCFMTLLWIDLVNIVLPPLSRLCLHPIHLLVCMFFVCKTDYTKQSPTDFRSGADPCILLFFHFL